MKEHLGSRHGVVFQQDWKRFCSQHCRCWAKVPCGWGTEIKTVKPKLKRKGVPSQLVNKECVYEPEGSCPLETVGVENQRQNSDQEEAAKCCKEVGRPGSLGAVSLNKFGREVLEEAGKPLGVEVLEKEKLIDSTKEEFLKSFKEVGHFESQDASILSLENEELDREMLYREILEEPRKLRRGGVMEGQTVKKLTCDRSFTRALTDKGGKLIRKIRSYSRAEVNIIKSCEEEEHVVLRGPTKSVEKAEQMLKELLSSAQEISLSWEEKEALITGGKRCIMDNLRSKLQVPVSFKGQKLLLFGKPEDTKKAKEMVEKELRLVRKILSGR